MKNAPASQSALLMQPIIDCMRGLPKERRSESIAAEFRRQNSAWVAAVLQSRGLVAAAERAEDVPLEEAIKRYLALFHAEGYAWVIETRS
ncbi:MAG: hypothetical protein Q7R81_04755 [Candidatus Peregrinibacteria bacterium]|nr:hypothetical protein [Candidatus Peregrinibacteria bacterium]